MILLPIAWGIAALSSLGLLGLILWTVAASLNAQSLVWTGGQIALVWSVGIGYGLVIVLAVLSFVLFARD